jgi:hypothetical protein
MVIACLQGVTIVHDYIISFRNHLYEHLEFSKAG